MRNSLICLLSMLKDGLPVRTGVGDLFGFDGEMSVSHQYDQADIDLIANFCSGCFDLSVLDEQTRGFFELSVNAFGAFVHAWMSELPIEAEILKFGRRVIASAGTANSTEEKRMAAEKAASDRGNADTLTVLNTAEKVQFEIHRMMGLLRFFPDANGVYIARCAPDALILPALGEYFTARFGETDWAVIDEKRGLSLRRLSGKQAKVLINEENFTVCGKAEGDDWESLWRHYHKTINNESRNNPNLQRQFMPKRYWKYLPEM